MSLKWFFAFIFLIHQELANSEKKASYFHSVPHHVLEGHRYKEYFGVSVTECILFCLHEVAVCSSVNYDTNKRLCEMSDSEANELKLSYKWEAVYLQPMKGQVEQSKVSLNIIMQSTIVSNFVFRVIHITFHS